MFVLHSFILKWPYSRLSGPGLFFSFVIYFYTDGRTPWTEDQPVEGRYIHRGQHKHRIKSHNTDIHALSGIRTHDTSIRASEESSWLWLRGHCDRHTVFKHCNFIKYLLKCGIRCPAFGSLYVGISYVVICCSYRRCCTTGRCHSKIGYILKTEIQVALRLQYTCNNIHINATGCLKYYIVYTLFDSCVLCCKL
jgi:hypothetical protein